MTTTGEINRAMSQRIEAAGLQSDCLADGNAHAKLVIVAEAPGPREAQLKLPLIGGSGKLLWECLAKFGIRRSDCYITNVVKKQLVDDPQTTKRGVSKNELSHWKGLLEWELAQLPDAAYVLCLGGIALEALTGETGIERWRGTVLPGARTIVATYNAANIIRKPNLEPIFRLDISKLDMVMRDTWKAHDISALYDPSPREAVDWCDKMIAEKKPVSFDIEVIANETACVGLANEAHVGMCINFRDRSANRWSSDDERRVRVGIQRVLRHSAVSLVAQNGGFDCGWLWFKDRIRVKPLWLDTLLAHHTLHPTWPHNLGFLTAQYTTHPFYKDDASQWREGGDISTFWEYNVKDVCITHAVATALDRELRQQQMDTFFYGHVMKLQPWLINATVLGNLVDSEMKDRLGEQYTQTVAALEARFVAEARIAAGDETVCPNPRSPKQLGQLLFRTLKLQGKTASTNAENRRAMAENPRTPEPARQMLATLDEWAKEHKLLSTYISADVDDDGRMRSDYKQFGVASAPGRLSSSQTLWGSGMNLQNQPERLRGMFIADPGYVFVYFDGAQAEARIVGWEAPIPKWKEQFERARLNPGSYDAHIALASEMYGVPYGSIGKEDYNPDGSLTLRGISKRCRHGLNYRMQAARLATVTRMSLAQAQTAFDAYHRANPELRRWWQDVIDEVKETRMLFSCMGRRMEFLGSRIDDALWDAVIAFKPQSALGDKVTYVQRRSQSDDKWPRDARIPFNNHDSLTALCRPKDVQIVAQIMKRYMEEPLIIKGDQLIIPSDFKVSIPDEQGVHRWSNMKKLVVE